MKNFTNFFRHLSAVILLAMVATISANADELTVFDGEDTNQLTPYSISYGDSPQRHEYIIPASELAAMKNGVISKMTFYTKTPTTSTPPTTFYVFLKEVEESSFSSDQFLNAQEGTKVFEGAMSIQDNKAEITFSQNYEYKGGNLLIGFYTKYADLDCWTTVLYYGVTQTTQQAIMGILWADGDWNDISGPSSYYKPLNNFLPKTTFTYEAAGETDVRTLANLQELGDFEFTDPMADSEDVILKLNNAKVTYCNTNLDAVIMEDATTGLLLLQGGMSNYFEAGQTLNGNLSMTVVYDWMGMQYTLPNGLDGVTVTAGSPEPMTVNDANAQDYANNYEWRYASIPGTKLNVSEYNESREYAIENALLGDEQIPALLTLSTTPEVFESVENGTVGTISGFLGHYYSLLIFFPLNFEQAPAVRELANLKELKEFELSDPNMSSEDVILNLNNVKVTYANTDEDAVMMEDESAGMMVALSHFSDHFAAGQTLNGTLALNIAINPWIGPMMELTNGIDGVTITEEEHTPFVLTEDNKDTYLNDYDWRYVQIADVVLHPTVEYGKTYYTMTCPLLSESDIMVENSFAPFAKDFEEDVTGTITGYYGYNFGLAFYALNFEEKQEVAPTEVPNIKALKEFSFTDPNAESEDIILTLDNVRVTAVADYADYVVLEDASAGMCIEYSGLNNLVEVGQVLNGTLAMKAELSWWTIDFIPVNGLEGVTVTTEDLQPIVVTEANINEYMADFEWRYAEISGVTLTSAEDDYGKYYMMSNELINANNMLIFDRFYTMDADLEDGTEGVITGFLAEPYGMKTFYVTDFRKTETAISGIENANDRTDDAIYNINGQRLTAPVKGINIINGRKVLVK